MSNVEKLMDKLRDTIRDDDQEKLLREFELETWKRGMRDAVPVAQNECWKNRETMTMHDGIAFEIDKKCNATWRLE